MTNFSKKSLLAVLVTALLSVVCAFCAINYVGSAKADGVAIPEEYVQATEGFTVLDSARVNITEEKSGIKFETEITQKAYKDLTAQGEVEFIAVATNVASGEQLAVAFKNLPAFETSEDAETELLNTYLNYDKIDEKKASEIYATDIKVETYAKITNGANVSYVKAMNAPQRAMRVVANAAWLNYKGVDTDGFELVDVEKYLGTMSRIEEVRSYSFADGTIEFVLPADYTAPTTDGASIEAYLGVQVVTATYDKDTGRYTVPALDSIKNAELGATDYLTVFGADNAVYSTKFAKATKITQDTFESLKTAANGYYVITEPIDMSGMGEWAGTHTETEPFVGHIDGWNNVISNFAQTKHNSYWALFTYFSGSIVNLTMTNATAGGNNGSILIGWATGDTLLENVILDIDKLGGHNEGGIYRVNKATATLKNVTINIDAVTCGGTLGLISNNNDSAGNVVCENVGIVAPEGFDTVVNKAITGDYGKYDVLSELYLASEETDPTVLPETITKLEKLGLFTLLDNKNFETLKTATEGHFIITEDINMTEMSKTWTSAATEHVFEGVLDGAGHDITNFNTVSSNWNGLFYKAVGILRNFNIGGTVNGSNKALLVAQLKKNTATNTNTLLIDNVNVYVKSVSQESASTSAVVTWIEGGYLTMKDCVVYVPNYGAGTKNGIITGGYLGTSIIYDNVSVIAASNVLLYGNKTAAANPSGTLNTYCTLQSYINSVENAVSLKKFQELGASITKLNEDNLETLLTATEGYYYLENDIDFAKVDINNDGVVDTSDVWSYPADTKFAGVLDGNGHSILNFVPGGNWQGLINRTTIGANIANLGLHMKSTGAHKGLAGQALGVTVYENVVVSIDNVNGTNATSITGVVQAPVLIKNCLVHFGATISNTDATVSGWFASTNGSNNTITIENSNVICENDVINSPLGKLSETNVVGTKDSDYQVFATKQAFNSAIGTTVVLTKTLTDLATTLGIIPTQA